MATAFSVFSMRSAFVFLCYRHNKYLDILLFFNDFFDSLIIGWWFVLRSFIPKSNPLWLRMLLCY